MATMTREHIHQSNLIEGYNDPEIDTQSFRAWDWLRHKKVIDNRVICELQRRLTAHQAEMNDMWRGAYRDRSRTKVTVGGRTTPEPRLVPSLMDNWILDMMSKTPKQSHIDFEHIHPFVDGNGRTGRMLMWWHEKQLGEPFTLFTKKDVDEYYAWF